jgi:hypothetical protein
MDLGDMLHGDRPTASATPVNGNDVLACATRAFASRVDSRNTPARKVAVSR